MAENQLNRTGADPLRPGAFWGELDVGAYLGVLRRRVWAVVAVFVIVLTLGVLYAFKATPVYEGVARVLIEEQSPQAVHFEEVVPVQGTGRDYYRTQQELVLSRSVLESAAADPQVRDLPEVSGEGAGPRSIAAEIRRTAAALLGLAPGEPPQPWERLRGFITVDYARDSHLLLVRAQNTDPEHAALLADAVARAFENYQLQRKLAGSYEAFRFLEAQKADQERKLSDAEEALQEFRERMEIVSVDIADRDNPALVRLSKINEELTAAQLEQVKLAANYGVVGDALEAGDQGVRPGNERLYALPEVRTDLAITELRTALVEAERDVTALADTYGPEHPQLHAAEARADLLRRRLHESLAELAGSLEPRLEMVNARVDELSRRYDEQNGRALELARQSLAYNRLRDEVARQRRLFDVIVERMREVDVTAGYARTNVQVVESAAVPTTPVRPRKAFVVLLSALLGLFLGAGAAFALEHADDKLRTPEDLEESAGIPVLGFVPDMDPHRAQKDGFARRGTICVVEPASSVTEAYRSIRTSLFFSSPAEEARILVVTSGGPGDGKTTTASNLALVIAQSGKRVLLADADFHRSMVHRVFGIEQETGLSTVLIGEASLEEAVAHPSGNGRVIENLDVLPAGPAPPNPADLLDSQALRRLLEEAREKYDRVILDTPPVLFVADASILGAIGDGVIVVARSGASTRSLTSRTAKQLAGVSARIIGGILNDVRVARGGYYSDYYHYGYARYYRDYHGSYYADQKR